MTNEQVTNHFLERIANALERIAPPEKKINNLDESEGFIYESKTGLIRPIDNINRVAINLLQGIIPQKTLLLENTINFIRILGTFKLRLYFHNMLIISL